MKIDLDISSAEGYHSNSQIARIITETWFAQNMYCPACESDHLDRLQNNTKVLDFLCPSCAQKYQLKSKNGQFGNTVTNSEYYTKIAKLKSGESPNWALLSYSRQTLFVTDLYIIPSHFMTLEAVQPRKPLSPTARRAGWVGSNILLNRLPTDSRLYIIKNKREIEQSIVRAEWRRFEFLRAQHIERRRWLNDVLICIQALKRKKFTLGDIYFYESQFGKQHPENKHVRAKIRQQLQVLRDNGIIRFAGTGKYELIQK